MAKTLCEWSKSDLEKSADKLARLVVVPRFYCRKCARVANREGVLCKPRELPLTDDERTDEYDRGTQVWGDLTLSRP